MTEKKTAEEILLDTMADAGFTYVSFPAFVENESSVDVFDISCRAMEAYAAQQSKMPTEDEMKKRQKDKGDYLRELGYPPQVIAKYKDAIKETWEWLRNQIIG